MRPLERGEVSRLSHRPANTIPHPTPDSPPTVGMHFPSRNYSENYFEMHHSFEHQKYAFIENEIDL